MGSPPALLTSRLSTDNPTLSQWMRVSCVSTYLWSSTCTEASVRSTSPPTESSANDPTALYCSPGRRTTSMRPSPESSNMSASKPPRSKTLPSQTMPRALAPICHAPVVAGRFVAVKATRTVSAWLRW
jgi:hypothetical protein